MKSVSINYKINEALLIEMSYSILCNDFKKNDLVVIVLIIIYKYYKSLTVVENIIH